ncbi:MAG: aquaporin [Actinomycetota bacterium]|nr:aquaporin [Actinomycetota bacterium]
MPEYTRKLVAELLGTFVLLTVGGFAIANARIDGGTQLLVIAFGFGLALLIGLYAFGEVSGGHFNPAVSFGAFIDGRIDVATFTMYVIAQMAGAVLAGLALMAAFSQDFVASTVTARNANLGVSVWDAFFIEVLFTALFVAVILKVTASEKFGASALIAIPLTLVVIHLGLLNLTGASVNPARSLGSAIVGAEASDLWVYLLAPMVGAFIGWGFYKLVTFDESDPDATQM